MITVQRVWKNKKEPLTWRHFAVALYWLITIHPMIVCLVFAALADFGDADTRQASGDGQTL